MKIGYARVSTREQNLDMQVFALEDAGCEKIYEEVTSGSKSDRPVLNNILIAVSWLIRSYNRNV